MGETQSSNSCIDILISTNHFNPIFRQACQPVLFANKRRGAGKRAELSLSKYLPATLIVITHLPGTSRKDRRLYLLKVRLGNKEDQFMHLPNPPNFYD